jgi:hypothetical protein
MNQPLIDRINALQPCGAELRGILLALAGQAAEPAKPAAKYPDGTRWVYNDNTPAYEMRDGRLYYTDGKQSSCRMVEDIESSTDYRRIDVPAPAPAKAPTMPPCVARLVDVLQSVALAKFPELCGTPSETKINAAIAAARAYYGEPTP